MKLSRQMIPILATDFLFWTCSSSLGPLLSRLIHQKAAIEHQNDLIAHTLLAFTLGTICGRLLSMKITGEPRRALTTAIAVSTLGFFCYYSDNSLFWLIGQVIHGFQLGFYGVTIVQLTSTLIPEGQRLSGFAMLGMADFLGFSFGPVLSGILVKAAGFQMTLITLQLLLLACVICSRFLPNKGIEARMEVTGKLAFPWKRFIPLHAAIFIALLYHLFYSRYLPILFDLEHIAIESVFFGGYCAGGILIRLGLIQRMENLSGSRIFFTGLSLMAATALLVASMPYLQQLTWMIAVCAGTVYGMGFELLYIFNLTWISTHASGPARSKATAFVFMGFDTSSILAGLTFGPLANRLTPMGLFDALLLLLPISLMLPLLLREKKQRPHA